jgi:hypothetical protein
VALAAHPEAGARYAGKGRDCLNDTAHHTFTQCNGTKTSFSFNTSTNGKEVLKFVGSYFVYCGNVILSFHDTSLRVNASGSFGDRGSFPSRNSYPNMAKSTARRT